MMAMPREQLPRLRVIDGGSDRMRQDELHVELMTFFSEVEKAAAVISNAEIGSPVPSLRVLHESHRMAYRAGQARQEYLALRGPDGDAA